jgi:hypothetical protein
MSNVKTIHGAKIDIETQAGGLLADIWGINEDDQNARRNSASHLNKVDGEGFRYNLGTLEGCQAFINDVADGELDGQVGVSDGSVIVSEGHVMVGDGAISYKLLQPGDYMRLRKDAQDGKLDGKLDGNVAARGPSAGAPPADESRAASDAPAGTTSDSRAAASPSAKSGGAATPASDAATDVNAALASVAGYSASELMTMMMNGNLPSEVANNPAAMNAIQMRVQEYMRMIQMMSDLMKMQHDMLMAISRNMK